MFIDANTIEGIFIVVVHKTVQGKFSWEEKDYLLSLPFSCDPSLSSVFIQRKRVEKAHLHPKILGAEVTLILLLLTSHQ